jgi:hypothetical protein
MGHGNEKRNWFFAHDGRGGGLPIGPCDHKHRTFEEAQACAVRRKLRWVCEVADNEACGDTQIEEG